jgi:hypothetical protein
VVGAKNNAAFFSALEIFPKIPCSSDLKSLPPGGRYEKFPAALRREFSEILQQEQLVRLG